MRIIAGAFRGHTLLAPPGRTTRPMTDRVRENLFNLLGPEACADAVVLDLFCGSGALGLEALSRGAAWCTFVDAARAAVAAAEANVRRLRLARRARVVHRDALRPGPWLAPPTHAGRYTLLFVDPPYKIPAEAEGRRRLAAMVRRLTDLGYVARGAVAVLRAARGTETDTPWEGFDLVERRTYGTTTLYLMVHRGAETTAPSGGGPDPAGRAANPPASGGGDGQQEGEAPARCEEP